MTAKTELKLPTSLRALDEAKGKTPDAIELARGRLYSAKPLDILVYPERNRRPINPGVVEEYKQAFLRGAKFPPVDVRLESGKIVLAHGYHRTLAAQEAVREKPAEMAHLQLELRQFVGNETDLIFLMMDSQNSLAFDPVSRAEAYHALNQQGLSLAKIAERSPRNGGKPLSAEHVAQQITLVKAEEVVKELIRADKIAATTVIALIKEEEQGGQKHKEAVLQMVANATAAGKVKAMPKHRSPAVASAAKPKLKMREVQAHLSNLTGISCSLRNALQASSVKVEAIAEGTQEDQVLNVAMPASKIAELLALLDKQAATDPVEEQQQASDDQADMFNENGTGAE